MKYTPEITKLITQLYEEGKSVREIVLFLEEYDGPSIEGLPAPDVPDRSIIAKLSALGIYKKKEYRTKRGEVPIRKEEYIDQIAVLLNVSSDILESLEKVNKVVLALLVAGLKPTVAE